MAAPAPMTAAYKDALLALQAQQRARLSVLVQQTEAMLHSDWQRGMGAAASLYQPVLDEYAKALNALRIAEDDPAAKLSLDWLTSQNSALKSIEQSVRASALTYGNASVKTVEDAQLKAMNAGLQDAENLTQEALFPASELGVNPAMLFNRPNPDAIAQFVGRAGNGHPLGDLFSNFPQEATSAARQTLLMGLATGANPVSMAQGISQAMGISRSRAITIARTEVLGSYRQAAHETYRANSDVLGYWMWSAAGNCCAMCAGMDGTLHDLSEDLVDHPCGRCAPVPVSKPWSDILGPYGIDASDLEETSIGAPGNYTSISEKFDSYSPAKQREIIGTQTGYEAYKRGELTLKDFIGVRPAADGFPSSYYQKSLKELQIPTRQAKRLVELRPDLMELRQWGELKYSDLGKITPDALMPAWAKRNEASRIVYQILRNGLPYDMTAHEQGLLVTNLAEMLKTDLPISERAAVERQLQALGGQVERLTLKSTRLANVAASEGTTAYNIARMSTDALVRETRETLDLVRPANTVANDLRARVSHDLAARLADNSEFAKIGDKFADLFAQDLRAKGYSEAEIAQAMTTAPKTPEAIAHTLLQRWASSNDSVYPALQQAIRDEFGLDARLSANTAGVADWADVQPGLRAFVRAMYDNTQDFLRENNILEMPLYRGTGFESLPATLTASVFDGQPQAIEMSLRAASSFTADVEQALEFARLPVSNAYEDINYELVMAARIPREMILSIPQTGFGVLDESEAIVLGGNQSLMAMGVEVANDSLNAEKAASLFTADAERQGIARTADTLAGARAETRDAQRALRAAEDAVRADYSRNPQGLLSSALANDQRVLSAQTRLEAAQARVQELRQATSAAKSAETVAEQSPATAHTESTFASPLEQVFQRDLSRDDIAKMLGASSEDEIGIEDIGGGVVQININNDRYEAAFEFSREDGRLIARGDVEVQKGERGFGSGKDLLQAMAQMRHLGVDEFQIEASREGTGQVGYDVWARLGFKGDIPDNVLKAAQDRFGEDVTRVEQIMQIPGGPQWWREHGATWEGVFDFNDPYSRAMFDRLARRAGVEIEPLVTDTAKTTAATATRAAETNIAHASRATLSAAAEKMPENALDRIGRRVGKQLFSDEELAPILKIPGFDTVERALGGAGATGAELQSATQNAISGVLMDSFTAVLSSGEAHLPLQAAMLEAARLEFGWPIPPVPLNAEYRDALPALRKLVRLFAQQVLK